MIFYTSNELFTYLADIYEPGDQVLVSTYGTYLGISKGIDHTNKFPAAPARVFIDEVAKDLKLVVGLTYFKPCKPNCEDCIENFNLIVDRLIDTKEMLGINMKVHPESHLKLYVVGDRVFTGGINLTGSDWVDIVTEVTDEESKEVLLGIFNNSWEHATYEISKFYLGE